MSWRWILCLLVLTAAVTAAAAGEGELAPPVQVMADGKPIDVEGIGYAAPFFADYDGDGVRDLLIGQFSEGRMRIFRNVGSDTEPRFEGYVFFQDGDPSGRVPTG